MTVIEASEYTLSEDQVRVLSSWRGSSADSASRQFAAIIRGAASPVWKWHECGTPGTRYAGFGLGLGAACFVFYKGYKKFLSPGTSTQVTQAEGSGKKPPIT